MKKFILIAACAALAGCASNTLVQLDDNLYQLNDQHTWTYSGGVVLNALVKQAKEVCAKQGKKYKAVESKTNNAYEGTMYAGATLTFRCEME